MTGSAVNITALKVREKALDVAAELLQTTADRLDIENSEVFISDNRNGPSVSLAEISERLAPGSKNLGGREPNLSAEGFHNTKESAFPYGIHFAVAKVDSETGHINVERFMVAYDVGRAVNHMLLEGQLVGGCVQGVGGALFEEFSYSEAGEPLAVTLADYLLPSMDCAPAVECLVTEDAPSPTNELGIKGGGEGGINGVGAAIAGAIDDAIGQVGAVTELPVTPQRMREILNRAGQEQ